ncbi:DUF4167 domain-containing protein [Novosphingobium flavum]|uniref:DUF4167 domain-containing protein n=1 Tax=Novosphingobium flavum TaxID=1778672 RepID=UPI001FE7E85B|nr:DUF4167 domain-containing protein [Novosphingobium flavum]
MNNNNRGNNRRRGRGNNRPQGGGQQVNRIDSRARGNAPQLLEKYRKLAHDAHLNGDRVTEEYYLQFAEHYFRVIADTRTRQEEQRARRDDRWEGGADEGEDQNEFSVESEYAPYEQPAFARRDDRGERQRDDRQREERPRDDRQREDRPREDRQREERPERSREDRPREERAPREERTREDRPRRREREREREEPVAEVDGNVAAEPAEENTSIYEPVENPFVRENRVSRGLRPRREDRRPRRDEEASGEVAAAEPTFDAALLPPSISIREEAPEPAPVVAEAAEAAPAPKKRGRKPKAAPVETADEA